MRAAALLALVLLAACTPPVTSPSAPGETNPVPPALPSPLADPPMTGEGAGPVPPATPATFMTKAAF